LVEQGNSVLVIEHNLDVIKTADWVIDLGPEGGALGGQVVASGTPEEVALTPASYTGFYLKEMLAKAGRLLGHEPPIAVARVAECRAEYGVKK
jgi:excinuclease UvrABC ATPase subunit